MMVRTRFAPSPTGFLHIGGLRTALFSYLTARQNKGTFILRIEDTDQKRYVEGATENLIKTLHAFGLNYDEGPSGEGEADSGKGNSTGGASEQGTNSSSATVSGGASSEQAGPHAPYFQSQRTDIYQKYAQELIAAKKAYYCFCTPERLEQLRHEQQQKKLPPMYDRHCLKLSETEIAQQIGGTASYVIRQHIPEKKAVQFHDLIRGNMHFESHTLDDQVLLKSDQHPTYHLANVVDDHLMEITHVIRGEEWLPSAPKHVLLYEAFGWTPPLFAHIPLLLNPDKSKLSKRQGHVAAEEFLKEGYLPEAIINFIALLGWNPGTEQEIFSMDELIEKFSLERVQKAGAVFTREKLDWFNGHYIRQLSLEELIEKSHEFLAQAPWFKESLFTTEVDYLKKVLGLEQERLTKLSELPEKLKLFFVEPDYEIELFFNEKMGVDQATASHALNESLTALEKLDSFESEDGTKESLINLAQQLSLKNGQLLWPMRVALSGEKFSPGVFELLRVLGKSRSIQRLNAGLEKIKNA